MRKQLVKLIVGSLSLTALLSIGVVVAQTKNNATTGGDNSPVVQSQGNTTNSGNTNSGNTNSGNTNSGNTNSGNTNSGNTTHHIKNDNRKQNTTENYNNGSVKENRGTMNNTYNQ